MDLPIYLQFLNGEYGPSRPLTPRYRWYVIEEKGVEGAAADDELGEDLWIHKSETDRVRNLRLPNLDYSVLDAVFAVSKSRIFIVGGQTRRRSEDIFKKIILEDNGILSIDLKQSDPSWKKCDEWAEELTYPVGVAVRKDDMIHVFLGEQVLRFDCGDVEVGELFSLDLPDDDDSCGSGFLLASTGSHMLLYMPGTWEDDQFLNSYQRRLSTVCDFDMYTCSKGFHNLPYFPYKCWNYGVSPFYKSVVWIGQFLIYFSPICPMDESNETQDYCPALYVYDMRQCKWLSQPVQGLKNNGIILPSLDRRLFHYASLMKVRSDPLKLALVWQIKVEKDEDGGVNDQTEVHWVKFILSQVVEGDIIFKAEILSSGTCYGGNTRLINCTAG